MSFQTWATTTTSPISTPLYDYPQSDIYPIDTDAEEAETAKPAPSSLLPFFGNAARERGYDLPEPFGININYMNMRQNIDVDSIRFSGLALGPLPLDNMFSIHAGNTRERSKTETLKLDAWLLPFMNVYALVGHTKGHSVSDIGVGINIPGSGVIRPTNLQDLKFKLDFKGTTYGVGTTFTGGVGNWFAALDTNYTQTHFDVLDGNIDAFTLTPRVGYRFTTPGIDSLHMPAGKLNIWVGSMYQNVQQEFKGNLNDLNMPSETLQQLLAMANKSGNGRFDVKQRLETPWNMLIGAQYEITRNFNVTTEFGFAQRNSFFVSGEYRF